MFGNQLPKRLSRCEIYSNDPRGWNFTDRRTISYHNIGHISLFYRILVYFKSFLTSLSFPVNLCMYEDQNGRNATAKLAA